MKYERKIKESIYISNILNFISVILNTYLLYLVFKTDMISTKYLLVVAIIIYI